MKEIVDVVETTTKVSVGSIAGFTIEQINSYAGCIIILLTLIYAGFKVAHAWEDLRRKKADADIVCRRRQERDEKGRWKKNEPDC